MALRTSVSENDHSQGNADAPIQLVEYGDYQCPYCGRAYPIVKQLQQQLGDDLRFIFRNFPLSEIHPQAKQAAIASEAAGLQGKFWEMHDVLFEHQHQLTHFSLVHYAKELGLDMDVFENDLADAKLAEKVEKDFYSGMRSGVSATPTFFINGEKYTGSWEPEPFLDFLQKLV